jgi:hypothetical protein
MGFDSDIGTEWVGPDRPRSLKRWFGIATLAVALLIIALRLVWGVVAKGQLQAAIDATRARGDPIYVSDLHFPSIPDERNSAWYYLQAFAAIKHPDDIRNRWLGWNDPGTPWTPKATADLGKLVDDETMALAIARQARPYSTAVWPDPGYANQPAMLVYLPDLNWARTLATLLVGAAFIDHSRGDDVEAIERIGDVHHEAEAVEQYYPSLIAHLVAIGIDAMASDAALQISSELRLSDGSSATRSSATSGKQVAALIDELGDERLFQSGGRHCWFGQRRMALDAASMLANATGAPTLMVVLIRPAFTADIARALKIDDEEEQAISQNSWPAAQLITPVVQRPQGASAALYFLSSTLAGGSDKAIEVHFRVAAERRAAMIALAIRLYREDHAGHWPGALTELAPNYLRTIPADPFSPTSAAFGYMTWTSGPIVYGVGQNGVDDGGSEKPLPENSKRNPQNLSRWDRLDAVFHLTPMPATTQPAS